VRRLVGAGCTDLTGGQAFFGFFPVLLTLRKPKNDETKKERT
jgi:hypothetical protein